MISLRAIASFLLLRPQFQIVVSKIQYGRACRFETVHVVGLPRSSPTVHLRLAARHGRQHDLQCWPGYFLRARRLAATAKLTWSPLVTSFGAWASFGGRSGVRKKQRCGAPTEPGESESPFLGVGEKDLGWVLGEGPSRCLSLHW